jgi:arylsulfatase A-like enzyme
MDRPNILLLYTDQHRWDALGANGNPDVQTPHLDQLAAESINFDHCFVQHPKCMPSRASTLTGQYPSTLGITHMGVPVPEDARTLPRLLGPYGYESANIGKLHFQPHANRDHREPPPNYGFDHLEIADEPGPYEDAYRAWVRRTAPDQLDALSVGLPPAAETWQDLMGAPGDIEHPDERFPKRPIPFRGRDDVTHTAFVASRTRDYLRRARSQPFLCIAGFYSPHSPWVVPERFLDRYDPSTFDLPAFPPEVEAQRSDDHFSDDELRAARHGYYAMVSEVDHHVGQILDTLDQQGLRDNTIVVFTADHGERLGEFLQYSKGYPGHDCVSRVPLLVRYPDGLDTPGQRVSDLVEAVDLVPTLLAGAGLPVPGHLQGRPLCFTPEATARDAALMEGNGWKTLRTDRYRYVVHDDGTEHLYDLQAPHGAYHDVADDDAHAAALARLRHRLLQRLLQAERPLPRTWPY